MSVMRVVKYHPCITKNIYDIYFSVSKLSDPQRFYYFIVLPWLPINTFQINFLVTQLIIGTREQVSERHNEVMFGLKTQ